MSVALSFTLVNVNTHLSLLIREILQSAGMIVCSWQRINCTHLSFVIREILQSAGMIVCSWQRINCTHLSLLIREILQSAGMIVCSWQRINCTHLSLLIREILLPAGMIVCSWQRINCKWVPENVKIKWWSWTPGIWQWCHFAFADCKIERFSIFVTYWRVTNPSADCT